MRLCKSLVIPMYKAPSRRLRSAYANHMERETGFEPATIGLEGRDSTAELLPPEVLTLASDSAPAFRARPRPARKSWWTGEDSNLRSPQGAADLQSAAFSHSATRPCVRTPGSQNSFLKDGQEMSRLVGIEETSGVSTQNSSKPLMDSNNPLLQPKLNRPARPCGAGEGNRTPDPLITNQMLYQLSYASPPPASLAGAPQT